MGLNKDSGRGGNTVFLSAINVGDNEVFWARRTTKDNPEAKMRISTHIGEVWEEYYKSITGYIEAVRIVDKGQYGEELEIRVSDDDENSDLIMLLQMPYTSDLGKRFIIRMENIDPEVPAEIGIFRKIDGSNDRRFLFVRQNGDTVANNYTRDGSKSLPGPEEVEKRGKVKLDWSKQEDALFDICRTEAISKGWCKDEDEFAESTFSHDDSRTKTEGNNPPAENPPAENVDDEDIPF